MNTISPNSKSIITDQNTCEPGSLSQQPWITPDDLIADIEYLIAKTVKPYVDPSNPLLAFDELQAECRAKLAQILHNGCLSKCETRAKAFAFIKTSFSNHIRSLVQKHAFTEKRTGVKPPPRQQRAPETWNHLSERTIQISSLTAIQMKPAGMITVGYIVFSYAGSKPFMGGIWEATQDPDAFIFTSDLNLEMAKFKGKVEQKMRESKQPAISSSSLADQLRSLAELKQQGVLTADEFEVAKKKLLS